MASEDHLWNTHTHTHTHTPSGILFVQWVACGDDGEVLYPFFLFMGWIHQPSVYIIMLLSSEC